MKNYISEGRAAYEDYNHGQFSKKLAEWAISNMAVRDAASGGLKKIDATPAEEVREALKEAGAKTDDKSVYTCWYLFNMAKADYPKSLTTDEQRARFVAETLYDPDCKPEAVLECFVAKMCVMGVPIHWERYL